MGNPFEPCPRRRKVDQRTIRGLDWFILSAVFQRYKLDFDCEATATQFDMTPSEVFYVTEYIEGQGI